MSILLIEPAAVRANFQPVVNWYRMRRDDN
jgi:hypothetical protein